MCPECCPSWWQTTVQLHPWRLHRTYRRGHTRFRLTMGTRQATMHATELRPKTSIFLHLPSSYFLHTLHTAHSAEVEQMPKMNCSLTVSSLGQRLDLPWLDGSTVSKHPWSSILDWTRNKIRAECNVIVDWEYYEYHWYTVCNHKSQAFHS